MVTAMAMHCIVRDHQQLLSYINVCMFIVIIGLKDFPIKQTESSLDILPRL